MVLREAMGPQAAERPLQRPPLHMPAALYAEMVASLRRALPEEACGLIGGRDNHAQGLYPVENRLHSPLAFEMDPVAQVEALMAIEDDGLELLAIYHSHPRGPSVPSETDVAQALYPDSHYVIISFERPQTPVARSFLIQGNAVYETTLLID